MLPNPAHPLPDRQATKKPGSIATARPLSYLLSYFVFLAVSFAAALLTLFIESV
jgi:hypothetical protein